MTRLCDEVGIALCDDSGRKRQLHRPEIATGAEPMSLPKHSHLLRSCYLVLSREYDHAGNRQATANLALQSIALHQGSR